MQVGNALFADVGKEVAESNSGSASTERSVAGSPLLNDDASQNVVDLENEAADDLNLSFHEKRLQQIMVLEGESIQNDRKHDEEGCVEDQNEDNDRKNNEVLHDNSESNDLPINELHKKRNQEENQLKAKPRMHKKGNGSASDQDQKKTGNTSELKLEDNGRQSPSVDSSDGMMKIAEGQIITDKMQEVSVNDQSEHGEAKNTSKSSVKKLSETKERVLENPKASLSDRSTTFAHLKRKGKTVPSTSPVSSHYLGSLKVLEDKRMQMKSPEFNKVDNLRAAVYQNWLEKKNLLLLELKRSEKEKAEILRNNTEKAFKKWQERKVEYLREQSRKEKQSERMRKKIEEDLVAEKSKVSVSAVEKWYFSTVFVISELPKSLLINVTGLL
ncbi:PREDICTED: microtubule-associated protein 9 [Pseudopodoces humilis]|uniref:microtubule-associated protein 9 n=1 Tax=Pseudopodoces humilis TaxID=181119 RepID=UPI0003954F50|nr:PREDICTED: microtubule-associated protein 9 [Pseudopodoces humilis]